MTVKLDNPDGTIETATALSVDTPHRTALHGSNDVDHYWFTARPGQTYRIRTFDLAPGCDTVLARVDPASGAVIALNDDASPGEAASELRVVAGPAQAYVQTQIHFRVQSAAPGGAGACGAYTVMVESCTEPGDTPSGALPLELGVPFRGELAAPSDIDYYRFTAYAGQLYDITTRELTGTLPDGRTVEGDTAVSLLAPDKVTVITADVSSGSGEYGASRILWRPSETGTYYLSVAAHQGRYGPYTVAVAQTSPGAGGPASRAGARLTIPDRDGLSNWLASPGEEHWYKFEAEAQTRYYIQTFDTGPSCDTVLTLYGTSGGVLASSDDAPGMGPLGAGSLIEWTAPARGVYYASVTSYVTGHVTSHPSGRRAALGHYRFAVTTAGPENDHYPGFAHRINPEDGPVTRSLVDGDWDWFRFEAVQGLHYTVETGSLSPGCDTVLWLVNPMWEILAANDDIDTATYASRVVWVAEYSGAVYAAVTPCRLGDAHPGTGLYTLTVTTSTQGEAAP